MTDDLSGRVALVTGSATGIGRAVSESLAARGAAIVAHGLDLQQTSDVAADWRARGWHVARSDADLATPGGADRLLGDVADQLGAIDILVLNASVEIPQRLADLTRDALATQVAVNLTASMLLLKGCLPGMRDRGWGRVVAIGSVQEERPNARHLFYAGTKAALTTMILDLARHDAALGVTLNVVRPGAILTDRNRSALADPDHRDAVLARIPLGRIGEAEDCVGVVSLLCSRAGAYINGAVVAVDGGMRL